MPNGGALRREIRLPHATALVAGTILGASIFVQPSEITARVPNVTGILLVWAAAGLVTLAGAVITARFAARLPGSGGVYVYLREAFGPALGFLWGWGMFWSMHSGIIAAIAVVFARYAGALVPLGNAGGKLVAVAAIVALSAVNHFGVRPGSRLQAAFTAVKLVAVALIVVLGVTLGSRVEPHFAGGTAPLGAIGAGNLLAGLASGLFAFGGWHVVTYSAGETVDPERTIPRALLIGTGIVTVVYIAMNAVYLYVLPLEQVAGSSRIAADLAQALLGPAGSGAVSALVMFSAFGALAGIVLAGPRVYQAMAADGLAFPSLGAIHPVHRTPSRAIWMQAAWASVLVATGTFRELVSRVIYTEWLFFGILALGLVRLGPGKGGAAVPLLFAAVAFLVAGHEVLVAPGRTLSGLALVLAGLPVYLLWHRKAA